MSKVVKREEERGRWKEWEKEKKGGGLLSWRRSKTSLSTKAINNRDLFFSDVFSSLGVVHTKFNYATQKGMCSVMS